MKFGDKLIAIILEKTENSQNDISLKKDVFKNLPSHEAIIITCDFLHFRQMIQLYRESVENYKPSTMKKIQATQIVSFENIIRGDIIE